MLEKISYLKPRDSLESVGTGPSAESSGDVSWSKDASGSRPSEAVVRLMAKLGRALHTELPIGKRISLLKDLQPAVLKVSARMPKPVVVSTRQPEPGAEKSQPLEQHLGILMAKNLQRAIKEIGHSGVPDTQVPNPVRLWLSTSLFRSLGGLIEYAVRWSTSYPAHTWRSLHELYFHFQSRMDLADAFESYGAESGFDPGIAYKRLLLLGLAGRLNSDIDRLPQLFDELPRLAEESRLDRPEGHAGEFGLFVVEISRDEPPYISAVVERGFRGWVFTPARGYRRFIEK